LHAPIGSTVSFILIFVLPLRSLPEGGADGWTVNQTGGMKTICFFDKAGGFDENLRKHLSALQTGDHLAFFSPT